MSLSYKINTKHNKSLTNSSLDTSSKENSLFFDEEINKKPTIKKQIHTHINANNQSNSLDDNDKLLTNKKDMYWSVLYSKFVNKNSSINKITLDEIGFRIKFGLNEGRDKTTKTEKITQIEANKQKRIRFEKKKEVPIILKTITESNVIGYGKEKHEQKEIVKMTYKDYLLNKKKKSARGNRQSASFLLPPQNRTMSKNYLHDVKNSISTNHTGNKQNLNTIGYKYMENLYGRSSIVNLKNNKRQSEMVTKTKISSSFFSSPYNNKRNYSNSNGDVELMKEWKKNTMYNSNSMNMNNENTERQVIFNHKILNDFNNNALNKHKNMTIPIKTILEDNEKTKMNRNSISIQKLKNKIDEMRKKKEGDLKKSDSLINPHSNIDNNSMFDENLVRSSKSKTYYKKRILKESQLPYESIDTHKLKHIQLVDNSYKKEEDKEKDTGDEKINDELKKINENNNENSIILSVNTLRKEVEDVKRIRNNNKTSQNNRYSIFSILDIEENEHKVKKLVKSKTINNVNNNFQTEEMNRYKKNRISIDMRLRSKRKSKSTKLPSNKTFSGLLKLPIELIERIISNNQNTIDDFSLFKPIKQLTNEEINQLQDSKFQQFIAGITYNYRLNNNILNKSVDISYNQFTNNREFKKILKLHSSISSIQNETFENDSTQKKTNPTEKDFFLTNTNIQPSNIEKNNMKTSKKKEKFGNLFSAKINNLTNFYNIPQFEFDYNINSIESMKNNIKAYEKETSIYEIKGVFKLKENKLIRHFVCYNEIRNELFGLSIKVNSIKEVMSILSKKVILQKEKVDQIINRISSLK